MRTPVNRRLLALIAAGAVVLGACSSSGATTAPSAAASGAPSAAAPSAAATAAGSPIPTAPPASLAISPAASAAASQTGLKATYISTGPIGDNPFLQLIANGLTQAGKDCGVQTSIVESKDTTVMSDNFRAAIDDKTDLIVANSFDSVDAITKLGKQFPDQKWAVVDTTVDNPNVRGLVFQEHEGTYLIGAIFGLLATGNYAPFPKSDVIGAVGAIDQPFIRRWLVGFQEGVKSVNPNAKLIDGFGNSFNDPATSKELALAQFNQGAKYIFSFAAAGNTGIFEAAKEKNFYTSGVDTDQRAIDPGAHPRVDGQADRPRRLRLGLRSGQGPVQGRHRRLRPQAAGRRPGIHRARQHQSALGASAGGPGQGQGAGGRHRQRQDRRDGLSRAQPSASQRAPQRSRAPSRHPAPRIDQESREGPARAGPLLDPPALPPVNALPIGDTAPIVAMRGDRQALRRRHRGAGRRRS